MDAAGAGGWGVRHAGGTRRAQTGQEFLKHTKGFSWVPAHTQLADRALGAPSDQSNRSDESDKPRLRSTQTLSKTADQTTFAITESGN